MEKYLITFFILLILIWAGILPAQNQSCLELLGSWGYGNTYAIFAYKNYLYAGSGRYLKLYDISISNYPKFLQEIMLDSLILKIKVEEREGKIIGYICTQKEGLYILDLTDSKNIFICSKAIIPCFAASFDIEIQNNILYIALPEFVSYGKGTSGVYAIDIEDIYNPKILSHFEYYAFSICFYKNYAIVGYKGLQIWDISNPENPKKVGSFEMHNFYPNEMVIKENFVYVAASNDGLYIFDISDPLNIKIVGKCSNFAAVDLEIIGDYAIFTSYLSGITSVCIKDPKNPYIVTKITPPNYPIGYRAIDLSIYSEKFVYVANYSSIWVLDLLDPTSYYFIETCDVFTKTLIKDNYLFALTGSTGLRVIDFSDPYIPTEVSRYKPKSYLGWDELHGIYLESDFLYLGGFFGFSILDVKDPKNLKEISYIKNESPEISEFWPIYDIKVKDGYAYTACYFNGFKIYNVQDKRNPFLLSSLKLEGGPIVAVELYKNFAYLSCIGGLLYIVDISNPNEPKLIESKEEFGMVSKVAIYDNRMVICGDDFYICDISDPLNPKILKTIKAFGLPADSSISIDILFLASFANYLIISNISDLENENEIYLETSGFVHYVNTFENYLFVSNFPSGLEIYNIENCYEKHKRPFL